jgi:hypothetical protein
MMHNRGRERSVRDSVLITIHFARRCGRYTFDGTEEVRLGQPRLAAATRDATKVCVRTDMGCSPSPQTPPIALRHKKIL